jgi:hypothetical protein
MSRAGVQQVGYLQPLFPMPIGPGALRASITLT